MGQSTARWEGLEGILTSQPGAVPDYIVLEPNTVKRTQRRETSVLGSWTQKEYSGFSAGKQMKSLTSLLSQVTQCERTDPCSGLCFLFSETHS